MVVSSDEDSMDSATADAIASFSSVSGETAARDARRTSVAGTVPIQAIEALVSKWRVRVLVETPVASEMSFQFTLA